MKRQRGPGGLTDAGAPRRRIAGISDIDCLQFRFQQVAPEPQRLVPTSEFVPGQGFETDLVCDQPGVQRQRAIERPVMPEPSTVAEAPLVLKSER